MILLTGFGAFPGVADNPTAAIVRGLDGEWAGSERIAGRVLPVSFERGPSEAIAWARRLRPRLVLGLGVAVGRSRPELERIAVRRCGDRPDVDGAIPRVAGVGPSRVRATVDVERLAEALDAGISDDAGRYVCNAWLYRVTLALPGVPVGFLHVPAAGISDARLQSALSVLTSPSQSVDSPGQAG